MTTTALLIGWLAICVPPQNTQQVTFLLKNNGLVPREFKFLEKRPGVPFNVFTTYLLPGQTYKVQLKVGTSLAQVNQQEINASMRGLDVPGKPLLVVKASDADKTINLVQKTNSSR